jgi:fatty acid desaturase
VVLTVIGADDSAERVYRLFTSGVNRTLLLLGTAYALGIASLLSYLVFDNGGASGVGRLEFALLAAAMGVIFYLLLYDRSF